MLKDFGKKIAALTLGFLIDHFAKIVCFLCGLAAGLLWF
jgi:hypothetical protein